MRVLMRLLSPLVALVVAAFGAIVTAEVVAAWLAPQNSPWVVPWDGWAAGVEGLDWSSAVVRGVAIGVGVAGLLVLLVGLVARRRDVPLTEPVPEVSVTTSPRSVARAVGHEVRSHADVVSASVVASRSRIVVKAGTLDPPETVRDEVRSRVDALLENLPLARRPRVSVSVAETKGVK